MESSNEFVTLDDLIEKIHEAFSGDKVDVDYVESLMSSYKSNKKEWKKFAKFDRYKYTRNLVDDGNGKFNIMILCWGPSMASTIHDHADSHCFLKVIDGSLDEVRFEWPEESCCCEMQVKLKGTLKTNEVAYINDSMGLHRVENPSHTEPAVSLHVYCPPYNSCQAFDERTGKRCRCPVTFYSKFGQRTPCVPIARADQ